MLPRVAGYGLNVFYGLVREELAGRRPLAKFRAINLILMVTFYQSLVVRFLLVLFLGMLSANIHYG